MSPGKAATYENREATEVERAVEEKWGEGGALLSRLANTEDVQGFRPELAGAIFCGHLVADLDSVAGAIGASVLYGGVPAKASEINSETRFALDEWGVDDVEDIEPLLMREADKLVCLVDFQQTTQLHPAIHPDRVVGIIDHHALQNSTIVTSRPIFVDIRPWGSMSTILAYEFATQRAYLPRPVAGMLLSAVLSDTLNLRSPTTTDWDRRVVAMLVQYVGVDDVNLLASRQFKAKSRAFSKMSTYTLINGDLKQFKFSGPTGGEVKVAFSVVETTDAGAILERTEELVPEMRTVKSELSAQGGGVKALFLAVVDIVALQSHLVIMGNAERSLAEAAFGGSSPPGEEAAAFAGDGARHLYDLGSRVSRKADFVPPLNSAVAAGWEVKGMSRSKSECVITAEGDLVMDYSHNPSGDIVRKKSKGGPGARDGSPAPAGGMERVCSFPRLGSVELSEEE